MKTGRLHIRVDPRIAEGAKAYAKKKRLTVNALVEAYLRALLLEDQRATDAEQV